MDKSDQRHSPRQKKEATIQVVFGSDDLKGRRGGSDLIPAKMCNQNDEGFYIETDRGLTPGSNVRLNMVSSGGHHPEEAHYMRDGRVIWCEKLDEAAGRFGVGIKILRKVVRAQILSNRFR